jgi:hypothetical protein
VPTLSVTRGLDPQVHLLRKMQRTFSKKDGSPGQARR